MTRYGPADNAAAMDDLLAAIHEYDGHRRIMDGMEVIVRLSDDNDGVIMDMTADTAAIMADIIRGTVTT